MKRGILANQGGVRVLELIASELGVCDMALQCLDRASATVPRIWRLCVAGYLYSTDCWILLTAATFSGGNAARSRDGAPLL